MIQVIVDNECVVIYGFRVAYLKLTWPILNVKVISTMVTYMAKITIAIKYKFMCRLSIDIFTIDLGLILMSRSRSRTLRQ